MEKYAGEIQQIWDYSSLMTGVCARKYKLSKIDKWRSKRDAEAPRFGTFAHEVFEVYDRNKLVTPPEDALSNTVVYALDNGKFLNELETSQFSLPCLIRSLVWYHEQFKNDPFQTAVDLNDEALLEKRFEVPYPTREDRRISGRIDRIVVEEDELIVVDRKFTTKPLNSWYFAQYEPSLQLSLYVWALRDVLKLPINRAMIEAHQVGVTFARCERRLFSIDEARTAELEKELPRMITAIDRAHETGFWDRDLRMCGLYGGCGYSVVCNSTSRTEQATLEEYFKKENNGQLERT